MMMVAVAVYFVAVRRGVGSYLYVLRVVRGE